MAKYGITQKLNLNGRPISTSLEVNMDAADLPAFLALLEGGYTVKQVDDTLSNITNIDTLVTVSNPVTSIGMVGSSGGEKLYASIRPFSGAIHFKNTVSNDDIAAVLKNVTPWALAPVEKPSRVTFKAYEQY